MNETSTVAVNTASIIYIYIEKRYPSVQVVAQCNEEIYYPENGYSAVATLQTFDSDDEDKNMTAAKKYLVELVDKLNSGGNL
ncbi:MAG: hypothetical protein IJS29_05640 [Selenomonadaceae bacterium]|nr:hypothetical protein [Selenomonadaceae bacterium]